jgi:hypothetical protein
MNNVVQVVQGRKTKLLTFFCPLCIERHTIAVRVDGEKIPLDFTDDYFIWNGDLVNPTINNGSICIMHSDNDCHVYILDGVVTGDSFSNNADGSYERLLDVSDWPTIPAKEEK